MEIKQQVYKIEISQENEKKVFETDQNLREFFYLLLKIDRRNNLEQYKKIRKNKEK